MQRSSGRAQSGAPSTRDKHTPRAAFHQTELSALAPYMLMMMMRNVTSDGFALEDPANPGQHSLPGCIIAAPSFPANTPGVDQNYVFNWIRDAAITIIEIAASDLPVLSEDSGMQVLNDYVAFAARCQNHAAPTLGHACYTIVGYPRPWSEQNDGPALQSIAMIEIHDQLDAASKALAATVIEANIAYLLTIYREPTTNLWEEYRALSFFARATQLRCFEEFAANVIGLPVPPEVAVAIDWLKAALQEHWNGEYYVSVMAEDAGPGLSAVPVDIGYDPNIDIVSAAVYGSIALDDTRLLATAGRLRRLWADPSSDAVFPINIADAAGKLGPLMGRYPGDTYDGDVAHPVKGGHPWPLCTCNFAELYYLLALEIEQSQHVPLDDLSTEFFAQIGVTGAQLPAEAVSALRTAGDCMLRAVIFHSDHYELSEQFDGDSGFEKSVRNLTWSYAAFLSAIRARTTRSHRSRTMRHKHIA